mgnify:CR=1 FL=1
MGTVKQAPDARTCIGGCCIILKDQVGLQFTLAGELRLLDGFANLVAGFLTIHACG